MNTEVALAQRVALSSTTARPTEEFSGQYDAATIEPILQDSLDDHAKSSDAITDAPPLAEGFAGIVYFATRAADRAAEGQREPQSTSMRGRRIPTRPWRLPAVNRNPKN